MLDSNAPKATENDFSPKRIADLNGRFETSHPDELLSWGFETFGSGIVLGTGFGPSGMFLIDRLQKAGLEIPVFYLDTHLLFDETYELRDRVERRFDIRITRVSTELSVEEQNLQYGEELWKSQPNRCCYLRKVLPLRNYLSDKKAWITGVRRNQAETRRMTEIIEWDPQNRVVKINPLATWTDEEVWDYIHANDLPYNPLHDEGYPSIGCIPCTSPVDENEEDKRAGRWNGSEKTECGIHLPSQEFRQTRKTG